MNTKLFMQSVTTKNDVYDVTFHVNEKNEVVATVENSAAQMMHKDAGLVDLSGRRTHVPGAVYNALLATSDNTTERQARLIESFKRVCVARLAWSLGCFAIL